ncbi:16S rRNA (cytosine(967)-C(5))-methyltransferase RsmB [Eubacterium sp. 1001713B170207_170306_E7]|uniref:16S rRNA (cytosine(967)-C(5))-methyltransferase RsmB n=1 Tax=Eubacterium sp. 1001713B170207_170306_E7 TaxID=2787097 RepID=UPI001896BAD8|nr:16S rRNA (cytosine(967)-C(5))-methyltransferase RsmB [Eubacterium sp. 1001713B170207_170306_E7]
MKIREQAVKTLLRVSCEGAYSNLETKKVLSESHYKEEDRGLYLNIVYGTLQNKLYLDYLLKKHVSKNLNKLDPEVLEILRMTVYQIYFLDKIPSYAAVNEAVEITGKLRPKARGFVNGVLRNVLRGRDADAAFDFSSFSNEKEALSVRYSIPVWIIHKYYETYGARQAEAIIPLLNEKPPFTIRVNTLKLDRHTLAQKLSEQGIDCAEGKLDSDALHLSRLGSFESQVQRDPLFTAGCFMIQDQGAMMAARLLAPQKKDRVLDMCAAPGGKTTHLSQIMDNEGTIIARDIFDSRLKLIEETAERLGIRNIETQKTDGCIFRPEDREAFDRILLDAPCSGLGIIRRKPEIRYTVTREARKELTRIQRQLLDHAVLYLKPGGTLVYCTCTVNRDENEGQIERVLREYPFMKVAPGEMNGRHTSPLDDGCDGFFMAKLKKDC